MLEAIENDEVPNSPKGNYLRFFEDSSTSKSIDKSMVPYPIQPGFNAFTRSYLEYGIHRLPDNSIRCVEWAPAARALYLKGDFNQWKSREFQFESKPFGKWVLSIPPAADGSPRIRHGHILKLEVETPSGELVERLCPWARYVKRSKSSTQFEHVFWDPPASERYEWRSPLPPLETPDRLRIYEAHVGIASDEEKVSTYTHFREKVLPRIKKLGYNAVELMAIMEHAYYGSFGYQVTSFFAPSSRYGTPDELRALVDAAHALGLRVLLDVVHSHASKNVLDGLNQFDGTDACFFRSGPSGSHPIWDSRMFDYGSREVLRFLLSNLRYWADEFRFDGYRFDGVTAMMYWSRGVDHPFSGDYHEYFGMHVDTDALRFLALANYMLHSRALQRPVLTISEARRSLPNRFLFHNH
jgi:1,4-alpha-glucan branching enzyme